MMWRPSGGAAALACLVLLSAAPPAKAGKQPGYVAFVVAGPGDPGVLPAFNAVSGANVNNVSIADPVTEFVPGQSYTYAVWSSDVTYSGTCTTSYTLTQKTGTTVTTLDSGLIKSYTCGKGTVWLWAATGKAIPASPGPATLTGIVTFGSKTEKLAIPILIQ